MSTGVSILCLFSPWIAWIVWTIAAEIKRGWRAFILTPEYRRIETKRLMRDRARRQ